MARRPNIDAGQFQKADKILGDIVSKFDTLAKMEQIRVLDLLPQQVDDVDAKMDELVRTVSKLSKSAAKDLANYTNRIKDLANRQKYLNEQLKIAKDNGKDAGEMAKQYSEELNKVNEELKKLQDFQGVWKKLAAKQGTRFLDWFGGSAATISLSTVTFGLKALASTIEAVYDYQEKWTAAIGNFRRQIGPATQQSALFEKGAAQLQGTLMGLGMSFEQAHQEMATFVKGFGFANVEASQWSKDAIKWGLALGVGTEAAAGLSKNFMLMGGTFQKQGKYFSEFVAGANAAGVSTADFTAELASAREELAGFGEQGQKTFISAASYARSLGVSIKSLQNIMHLTDTFSSTAEAAAKMNTVFGTSINAMDLMLEQDPGKRFEMIRTQLVGVGKDMKNLTRIEKEFLGKTLGMSVEDVNAMTKAGKTYTQFMKEKEKHDQNAKVAAQNLNAILAKATTTLLNWSQVAMHALELAKPFVSAFLEPFGISLEAGNKGLGNLRKTMIGMLDAVARELQPLKETFKEVGESLRHMWKDLTANNAAALKGMIRGMMSLFQTMVKAFAAVGEFMVGPVGRAAMTLIEKMAPLLPYIGGAWLAGKAIGGVAKGVGAIKGAMGLGGGGGPSGTATDPIHVVQADAIGVPGGGSKMLEGVKSLGPKIATALSTAMKGVTVAGVGSAALLAGFAALMGWGAWQMKDAQRHVSGQGVPAGMSESTDAEGNTFYYQTPQVQPRARGGPVAAGSPYVVGENGSELFVPSQNGGIVPNGMVVPVQMTMNLNLDGRQIQRVPFMMNVPVNIGSPGM